MFRKAWGFLVRYRYAAALSAIALLTVTAVGVTLRMSSDADSSGVSSPTPIQTPNEPTANGSGPLPASDPGKQPEPLPGTNTPSFHYAACPPDISLFPGMVNASSGYSPAKEPVRQPLERIRQISVGHLFDGAGYGMEFGNSYALAADGSIYRWGIYEFGKGTRPDPFPQKLNGVPSSVIQVDGRFAVTNNGDVYDLNTAAGPKKIPELSGAVALSQAEDTSVYVIDRDGRTKLYSLFGPDSEPSVQEVHGFGKVKTVEASPYITLALDSEGALWKAPGRFSSGLNTVPEALLLPNGERVKRMEATMSHEQPAFILSETNQWFGLSEQGVIEPVRVPANMIQITAAQRTVVGLKADGTVWAWGDISNLLKSEGQPVLPESPRQLKGLDSIKSLVAGTDHVLALTKEGRVLTVGSNMYGQLGRKPIFATDLLPLGTWRGVEAMFHVYGRIFMLQSGNLWELSSEGTTRPVLLGQKTDKAFAALGHFAVLTQAGQLIVAEPEETKPCKILQATGPIVDASAASNGVLLALGDGSVYHIEGNTSQVDKAVKLKFDPAPRGTVQQVSGDPVPFALTDQGELYYKQSTIDGVPVMKPVDTKVKVKQWSPMHYLYQDGIGYVGKLLDENNQVYELELTLNFNQKSDRTTGSVVLKKTGRTALKLAGGAEIDREGRIRDQNPMGSIDARLPSGTSLRATSSSYHYPIEGRTYFQHLFAMEDGTMYWLGDASYAGPLLIPGEVVLSK